MRIFLSYTTVDQEFARSLEQRLRWAGISVWRDESALSAATDIAQTIEREAAKCDHGVFVVSRAWLGRDWTTFELELFAQRNPEKVLRVPILRAPREELVLPPRLVRFAGIVWLPEDDEPDARFWQLWCALHRLEPGDVTQWAAHARALSESPPPQWSAQSTPPPLVRPSLPCDRSLQWQTMGGVRTSDRHELVLVPGAVGQDHDHFVARIQHLLESSPPRSIWRVLWKRRPCAKEEFFEALAYSFGVHRRELTGVLTERLSVTNLILLHPRVSSRFLDNELLEYYSKWLPELLAECRPRKALKCVQPVEWPNESLAWSRIRRWLLPSQSGGEDGREEAEHLVEALVSETSTLDTLRLSDLCDVKSEDIEQFFQGERLTASQKKWLLSRLKARRPKLRTPKDLFEAIDVYLPDARSIV